MSNLNLEHLDVKSSGSHYDIIAVSHDFNGLTTLKRHQLVYKFIAEYIKDNSMHAVTLNTYSKLEWDNEINTNIG